MNDYYEFPYVMAMHILADIQTYMRWEFKKYGNTPKGNRYWELCKRLCGDEHAQWIYEHDFPKEVKDHRLF